MNWGAAAASAAASGVASFSGEKHTTAKVFANCSYWQDDETYAKSYRKNSVNSVFTKLSENYDLRCAPKPAGAHDLIGFVDSSAAMRLLDTYGLQVWKEEERRQQRETVLQDTESIFLLHKLNFLHEKLVLPRWKEWESIMRPVVEAFCEKYGFEYDEVDVWKAVLAKLPAGKEIPPHRDQGPMVSFPYRVHWVVSPEVGTVTTIGSEVFTEHDLPQGTVFQFNNIMKHKVQNQGNIDRVHLLLDIVPKKMAGIGLKDITNLKDEL